MSLEDRKDDRTDEEFESDIEYTTRCERIWSDVSFIDFIEKARARPKNASLHPLFRIWDDKKDSGLDNTGKVVKNTKGKKYLPDYDFLSRYGNRYIEISTWSCESYFTIKKGKAVMCSAKDAFIIVPHLPQLFNQYFVIAPESLDRMLKNYESAIYKAFSPNDLAIRIYKKDIKEYLIGPIPWSKAAKKIISENYSTLKRRES